MVLRIFNITKTHSRIQLINEVLVRTKIPPQHVIIVSVELEKWPIILDVIP